MHITVNRSAMAAALAVVQRAVGLKPPLAALSCVHLKAEGGTLEFTATDLELTLRTWVPAEISEEGRALLPARVLTDLIRRVPDETVVLSGADEANHTVFRYGGNRVVFAGLPPSEFPEATVAVEGPTLSLNEGALRDALREVIFAAASTEENHPLLSAVCFAVDAGATEIVATDTYRLAWRRLEHHGVQEAGVLLIPLRALAELTRLLSPGERTVELVMGAASVTFRHNDFLLSSRLLEGQFPNYRTFLPQSWCTRVRLAVKPFLEALERAALIVGKPPVVRFRLEAEGLLVEAVGETGRLEERVPLAEMEGEPLEIAFNPNFVADALRAQPEPETVIEFTGPLSAAVFRPVGKGHYFSLLLPVRLL
ncbi:MAG: DNA polymerase III subunit beta [Firmicutes bacterium]|nr:DNA polymerase III subunit beta [Bacillota bacterium]